MRKRLSKKAGVLPCCVLACLACVPCRAQEARGASGPATARASFADSASVLNRVKGVESPAFRAYLYARVAAWLSAGAGEDQARARLAVEAAAAGVSDIHAHEGEIPPAPASGFYGSLLEVARRHNPEEAERLRQSYPLALHARRTDADRAALSLRASLAKLGDPQKSAQGLEEAAMLVAEGHVPHAALHGELLHLAHIKSPALPRMLSAVLTPEERSPGSLPVDKLFFLCHLYLNDATAAELQTRFLAAAVGAARLRLAAPAATPQDRTWAILLLRETLPSVQKLTPGLYAAAAAQLAAAAPNLPPGEDVFGRIRNSPDPLAQAVAEANFAPDARLKSQLFGTAARLAKEQGKLRQAVELLSSVEEERRGAHEEFSPRDELFDAVLQDALKRGEVETAVLAASKIELPPNRAVALRRIARHLAKSGDEPGALRALGEASAALERAPEGKEKAIAYFELATDFDGLDDARALASVREGVEAVNNLPAAPPDERQPGAPSWSLFPVAESAVKAFRALARKDRAAALGLAETFRPKEFRVAAVFGVYSAEP